MFRDREETSADSVPIEEEYYDVRFFSWSGRYFDLPESEEFCLGMMSHFSDSTILGVFTKEKDDIVHYILETGGKYVDRSGVYSTLDSLMKVLVSAIGEAMNVSSSDDIYIKEVNNLDVEISKEIIGEVENALSTM
jgi:hypothetical protein